MHNHPDVLSAIRQAIVETADEHGIAKLADLGNHLRERGVDYKGWGYPKLTMLLQEFMEHLSIWQDKAFSRR